MWCGVKNALGMLEYSKEYFFPVLFYNFLDMARSSGNVHSVLLQVLLLKVLPLEWLLLICVIQYSQTCTHVIFVYKVFWNEKYVKIISRLYLYSW
jgi:hypothetical protein